MGKRISDQPEKLTLGAYRFRHQLAIECLALLAPNRRHGVDYEIVIDADLEPLYREILRSRSAVLRELSLIIAELFDPPPRPRLYQLARPLALHVLNQYRPGEVSRFREAAANFHDLLTEMRLITPADSAARSDDDVVITGFERSHPLFAMHLLSARILWEGKTRRRCETLTPGYQRYALLCHVAYRGVQEYYLRHGEEFTAVVRGDHLYRCSLSLRYLMQCLLFVTEEGRGDWLERDIRLALSNLAQRWVRKGERERNERLKFHGRNMREALTGTWDRRQGSPTAGDPGGPHVVIEPEAEWEALPDRVWPDRVPADAGEWADRVRWVAEFPLVPATARTLGESPLDYASDAIEIARPGPDRPAAWMARLRQAQCLHRDLFWFPYDRAYFQLYEYAGLYRIIFADPSDEREPTVQAIGVVLLLLIHLGIDPAVLLRADLRRQAEASRQIAEGILVLDPERVAVCQRVPMDVGYAAVPNLPSDEVSRPVGSVTVLPLPPFLRRPVEDYLATRARLAAGAEDEAAHALFLRPGELPTRLTLADVYEFLRSRGEADPAGMIRRIVRSFFALYVSRLGLDPTLAAYVAGTVPRLVASQHFYHRVDGDRLVREYWTKATGAHALICRAVAEANGTTWTSEVALGTGPPAVGLGYGSRIVPVQEALPRFSAAVRAELSRLEGFADEPHRILYFNLFNANAYVGFELASGARPLRDGQFAAALGALHRERVRIADKQSPRHAEFRTLRRTPYLVGLRQELQKARQWARALPSFNTVAYEKLGRPLLFLLRWDGVPINATPGEVRRVLDLFPEVGAAYPFPANVGRHLLETGFSEAEIDRAAKDYGLGHQRRWKEALGRFSTSDLPWLEGHFAEAAASILEEFGLELLRFREGDAS